MISALTCQNGKDKVREGQIAGNCPAMKGIEGREGLRSGERIRGGVDVESFEMEEGSEGWEITWTAKRLCLRR